MHPYISLQMKKDRLSGWKHFTLKHTNWLIMEVSGVKIALSAGQSLGQFRTGNVIQSTKVAPESSKM